MFRFSSSVVVLAFSLGAPAKGLGQTQPSEADAVRCENPRFEAHFANWAAQHPKYRGPVPLICGRDSIEHLPERIAAPWTDYPSDAAIAGFEGAVAVELVIDTTGRVRLAEVLDADIQQNTVIESHRGPFADSITRTVSPSTAYMSMTYAAVDAVRRARYRPAYKD